MGNRMEGRLWMVRSKHINSKRGTTFVMVTFFFAVLVGFAALSIDVANVYRERHRTQMGTDAGALAGAGALLKGASKSDVVLEATRIAATNGVTDAEIAAGAHGGFPGAIQVGTWNKDTQMFTPSPPAVAPFNAVRVPARRTVSLYFGKVVGLGAMRPATHSVAVIGTLGVPVGVAGTLVTQALSAGGTLTVCGSDTGNWGPLQLCDGDLSGKKDVENAIRYGNCFLTLGDTAVRTGFAGVKDGFEDRLADGTLEFAMPIVDAFGPGGSTPSNVLNVMLVKLISVTGSGNNFCFKIFIEEVGLPALTSGTNRSLVE
jgi:Flp pilus assembly protein TadG